MNERQRNTLQIRKTDTDGVLKRLGGDQKLFEVCMTAFLNDPSMEQLNAAVAACLWDEAFTAAHALKGVAGNMGFYPLMHKTGQLIVLIRGGRINDIPEELSELNSSYRDVIDGIHQYFAFADDN